ncbi:hypothetical protein GCM10022419_068450 [Nonomuraea rosea]|uniref:Uncharacterized protein n=1 Tax=Nonomuraea rosea TaxID=638574 RepID=A0ABP6Y4W4_9ACTN
MRRRGWVIGGALVLGAVPSVPVAAAGVSLVLERVGGDGAGKWIRTGDVQRFRVRLNGMAHGVRVAVAASPVEALGEVACVPSLARGPREAAGAVAEDVRGGGAVAGPSDASPPVAAPAGVTGPADRAGSGAAAAGALAMQALGPARSTAGSTAGSPAGSTTGSPVRGAMEGLTLGTVAGAMGSIAGGSAVGAAGAKSPLPPSGARVCALGDVSGSHAVDVTLTAPAGAKRVVLAAVARMQAPSGGELTTVSKTAALRVAGRAMTFSGTAVRVHPSEAARPGVGRRQSATAETVGGKPAGAPTDAHRPAGTGRADRPGGRAGAAGSPGDARKAQQAGTGLGQSHEAGARSRGAVTALPGEAGARESRGAAAGRSGGAGARHSREAGTGRSGAGARHSRGALAGRPGTAGDSAGVDSGILRLPAAVPPQTSVPSAEGAPGVSGQVLAVPQQAAAGAAPQASGGAVPQVAPGVGRQAATGAGSQAAGSQAVPGVTQGTVGGLVPQPEAGLVPQVPGAGEQALPGATQAAGAGAQGVPGGTEAAGAGERAVAGVVPLSEEAARAVAPLPWEMAVSAKRVQPVARVSSLDGPRGFAMAAGGIGVLLGALWLIGTVQRGRKGRKVL